MKIFKICTKKESQETGKKSWPEIGVLFSNEQGQLSGYLNNNPDVQIYLFEQQPKQQQTNYQQQPVQNNAYQQPPQNRQPNIQPGDQSGFGAPPTDGVPF
jgi:adenylate cyclase